MAKLRAFIVEDEEHNREYLTSMLNENFRDKIEICGASGLVVECINFIKANRIDVLFLDIELEDGQVFDILQNIEYHKYKLIFITGYSEHAIRAIKFSAVDYLLKPIDTDELIAAVHRVMHSTAPDDPILRDMISRKQFSLDNYLVINNRQSFERIALDDISHLEADGAYTVIHHKGAKTISSKAIGIYEDILPGEQFSRCHKSYIVNRGYIARIGRGRVLEVIMRDKTILRVASRKKDEFNLWFRQ